MTKWVTNLLICSVVVLTGVVIVDGFVMTSQQTLIRSMMRNKACTIDLDQYKSNAEKLQRLQKDLKHFDSDEKVREF